MPPPVTWTAALMAKEDDGDDQLEDELGCSVADGVVAAEVVIDGVSIDADVVSGVDRIDRSDAPVVFFIDSNPPFIKGKTAST